MEELTQNEKDIIEVMRDLRPFEHIEISKDKEGKPDYYIIKREQKVFFIKR